MFENQAISNPSHREPSKFGISPRRSACDRCRGHKLRCNRDATAPADTPCHRCTKAKSPCIVTSSSRPGKAVRLENRVPSERPLNLSTNGVQISTNTPLGLEDDSDSPQLNSGPWMDLIDMNGQESASLFDFNSPMQTSNVPIDLIADQPLHFIDREASDTDIPKPANWESMISSTPQGSSKSPQHGPALTHDPLSNNSAAEVSQPVNPMSYDASVALTPEERKELCIEKLSDLNASLMKNLNRQHTCSVAASIIMTSSDKSIAEYLEKTIDSSSYQSNAIGIVLRSTEQFLQIINEFRTDLPGIAHQPWVELSGRDGSMEELSEEERVRRFKLIVSYKDRVRPPELVSSQALPPTVSSPRSSSTKQLSTRLSISSTLTILTCYTCILKTYETMFATLNQWLSIPSSSGITGYLLAVIAGVQINGFALGGDSHRSLQVQIFLQVCNHMLNQMEKALWFGDGNGDRDGIGGALVDPTFEELLKVLLKQEGLDCDGENKTGMKKVRDLLNILGERWK